MAQVHLTASSHTFACESCGHLNVVPSSYPSSSKSTDKTQEAAVENAQSEHETLEQVDLPTAADTQKPARTVSKVADDADDLNAVAAANAANDGKLEQHLEELHVHQAHAHGAHHLGPRRASHLHPSGLVPRRPSLLSRSSSEAQEFARQEEQQHQQPQQLPQQSGSPLPHPPATHLSTSLQPPDSLQHIATGSATSSSAASRPGSRSNSGVNMPASEGGTVVFTLKGPTEVILAQIQRSTAALGSGASSHNRTPSGTPMARAGILSPS